MTVDEIIVDYPDLQPEDIHQALAYGAWLAEKVPGSSRVGPCMKLLADMGISPRTVEYLRSEGP